MTTKLSWTYWILAALLGTAGLPAEDFEFYPGAVYDPDVPTLQKVVGHSWAEKITMHHEVERYISALAEASPLVQLQIHGASWEGRKLYHLIVTSEANQARLGEVQQAMQKLADPRKISDAEAESIIQSMPSVVWLAYGVHGNEISSTDAALLTAYHLAAAQNDPMAQSILDNAVVIIDPMQNPDGRDRFIHYFRQTRGRWPDPDPQSAEHNEVWPSGRVNHYLFDMNRDWFAQTQAETHGRLAAYLKWHPQIFVDLHEMGTNSTYYFAPPADPLNPEFTPAQVEWLERLGRNNARWFDRFRFDYFTREVFDSFYPGYGEGWPMFKGSIGMTYEQASVRGLATERDDDTTIRYRDSVQHHFIASLSTAQTGADNREALLRYFYGYRKDAIEQGRTGPVREYIIAPGRDPNRAVRLARKLMSQGIEVKRAKQPFSNPRAGDYYQEEETSREFPAGTFVVSLQQPDKHLATALLEKHIDMDEGFVEQQKRLQAKRMGLEIYDITGWSVPLLYGVEAYRAAEASAGDFEVLASPPNLQGALHGDRPQVAYLIPWGTNSAARALAWMFSEGIRVHSADKPFTIALPSGERTFGSGSLIVKVKDNPQDLHERLQQAASRFGVDVYAADSSWVSEGINFGSGNVQFLKKPRVAMAYNNPVSPLSAGAARYLLEQEYGYPVTLLRTDQLRFADLDKYNVLILPDAFGSYSRVLDESVAGRLRDWLRGGGTLISTGDSATRWLTEEKVKLLDAQREMRGGKPVRREGEEKPGKAAQEKEEEAGKQAPPSGKEEPPARLEDAIQPEEEAPFPIEGAILRVTLDTEHWLAYGYEDGVNALVSTRTFYSPLKLDQGRNVGLFAARPDLLLSGFAFEETLDQIANKPYLMHERIGDGHVVAFADDPNFRAFCDGLNLLFMNAVLFGPGR